MTNLAKKISKNEADDSLAAESKPPNPPQLKGFKFKNLLSMLTSTRSDLNFDEWQRLEMKKTAHRQSFQRWM